MQRQSDKVTFTRAGACTGFPMQKKWKYVLSSEKSARLSQINKVLSQTETGAYFMTGYTFDYEQVKIWHSIGKPILNHY